MLVIYGKSLKTCEVPPLPYNPTIVQIKNHNDRKQRKSKARATLLESLSSTMLIRIMMLKTLNEIWEFLQQEYNENEKVKVMHALDLI